MTPPKRLTQRRVTQIWPRSRSGRPNKRQVFEAQEEIIQTTQVDTGATVTASVEPFGRQHGKGGSSLVVGAVKLDAAMSTMRGCDCNSLAAFRQIRE